MRSVDYGTLALMKLLILYRARSEQAQTVDPFIRDLKMQHPAARLEVLDLDSRDGIAMATLYDVMHYPAILALRDDGSVIHSWEGETLPLLDEVAYYTFDQQG